MSGDVRSEVDLEAVEQGLKRVRDDAENTVFSHTLLDGFELSIERQYPEISLHFHLEERVLANAVGIQYDEGIVEGESQPRSTAGVDGLTEIRELPEPYSSISSDVISVLSRVYNLHPDQEIDVRCIRYRGDDEPPCFFTFFDAVTARNPRPRSQEHDEMQIRALRTPDRHGVGIRTSPEGSLTWSEQTVLSPGEAEKLYESLLECFEGERSRCEVGAPFDVELAFSAVPDLVEDLAYAITKSRYDTFSEKGMADAFGDADALSEVKTVLQKRLQNFYGYA